MLKRLHIIFYTAMLIYTAGCMPFPHYDYCVDFPGLFERYTYIIYPAAYYELKGKFPQTTEAVDSLYSPGIWNMPEIKISSFDSDSICFKAYVYPVEGKLNSESYFEIAKQKDRYLCSMFFDFTAKSDSLVITYDKYQAGAFSIATKDTADNLHFSGSFIQQSGSVTLSHRK